MNRAAHPNHVIRRLVIGRSNPAGVLPAWLRRDDGSPLWLTAPFPDNLVLLPMPGDQVTLSLTRLKADFERLGAAAMAQKVGLLMQVGNATTVKATVMACNAQIGVLTDRSAVYVGEASNKVVLSCPKLSDKPLSMAASRTGSTKAIPGTLERLSVPTMRDRKPEPKDTVDAG